MERLLYFNLAFLLSFFLEIQQSRFLEILLSILLSCLKYGFQPWNLLQIKGEKTSVFRCVPICPFVSRFVHQLPILQHYKSPLLCSGVTNRRGQRCKTGLVNGRACRSTLTPIRPGRIFDFRQKIARCVSCATKPFSVPENALPLSGVKITPKS